MSKRMQRQILDANAMVMGGGVGLAALEAMFNLVQCQSLLASGMVKHHDMAYGAGLQTLSATLKDILESGKADGKSGVGDSGAERGAVSGVDELSNMFKSNANASATVPDPLSNGVDMDQHLTELLELLSRHLSEILKSSQPAMMVT